MISILVLTLNEEQNLPACLRSVAWSDDIVVLDSYSTDATCDIARAAGARVFQRKLEDWASHQNWAVQNIPFKHPWVYYTDADEVVPDDLRDELLAIAADPSPPAVAYRVRFKNQFMGRWIRRSSLYPTWVLRFFRPEKVRWERLVNPVAVVDGQEGRLQSHFLHYSFNKGLSAWIDKHNKYSTQEALEAIRSVREGSVRLADIASGDHVKRRRALKELSWRMPCRPLLRFLYMYVVRLGFLDGWAGFTYCRLIAMYEYMIDLKVKELKRREQGLPV
jgi:glycosyltransferase involved in cell wall biosynthesis